MNSADSRRLAVLAAALCATGLTACNDHAKSEGRAPAAQASPSAILIGTAPAEPSGDPPGTTPVTAKATEITKQEETREKPQEGDHSHSTLAETTPQKAEGVDAQAAPAPAPKPYKGNEDNADPTRKPTQAERSKPEGGAS